MRRRGRPTKEESAKRIFPTSISLVERQHLTQIAAREGITPRQLASQWLSTQITQNWGRLQNFQRRWVKKADSSSSNVHENSVNATKAIPNMTEVAKEDNTK